jgi:hypothetical protein
MAGPLIFTVMITCTFSNWLCIWIK